MPRLSEHAASHRKVYLGSVVGITVLLTGLVVVGTLRPEIPILHPLTIDTDPENMLSSEEPVRVSHDRLKETFGIHDYVVVGGFHHGYCCRAHGSACAIWSGVHRSLFGR